MAPPDGSDTIRGRAVAGDGVPLHYEVRGTGARPRVALLHGLGMDRGMWSDVAARLAPRADLLLCDLRGHGRTPLGDAGALTPRACADDLARVLDTAGWDGAVLVGWSLGASVAVATAVARPGIAAGLVLVSATATYGPGGSDFWEGVAHRARRSGLAVLADELEERWLSDGYRLSHPDVAAQARRTFAATPLAGFVAACAMLGSLDLRPLLPVIDVPTEVVVGTEDVATPTAMASALAASIPGASLTEVVGARHLVPVERPDEVAASVVAVLARQTGGRREMNHEEGEVR